MRVVVRYLLGARKVGGLHRGADDVGRRVGGVVLRQYQLYVLVHVIVLQNLYVFDFKTPSNSKKKKPKNNV